MTSVYSVRHDGRVYQLVYSGDPSTMQKFMLWAATSDAVHFMHDYHHELADGLRRRTAYTSKPPTISGYAGGQWTRFIYGHALFNDFGPLIGKLHAAIHPNMARLYKSRS